MPPLALVGVASCGGHDRSPPLPRGGGRRRGPLALGSGARAVGRYAHPNLPAPRRASFFGLMAKQNWVCGIGKSQKGGPYDVVPRSEPGSFIDHMPYSLPTNLPASYD